MGSATFPLSRIHRVAAASCVVWSLVSLLAHLASLALWPGYSKTLRPTERRQWCNKIACGLHAAVLAYNQAWNLFDPVLNADPLHGVTDSHFLWGSVLLGYLVYDTLFSLAFFKLSSGAVMLGHHLVGIAGCVIGVYFNKLALFGLAIEVFFESCNPLLHVIGCMRIAGRGQGRLYDSLSKLFLAQFFLFRVVISNAYFFKLLGIVLHLEQQPWWAWAGAAVFASLNLLNAFWLAKLVLMAVAGKPPHHSRANPCASAGATPLHQRAAGGDAAAAPLAATGQPATVKQQQQGTSSSVAGGTVILQPRHRTAAGGKLASKRATAQQVTVTAHAGAVVSQ
ncbi:hypothetical protein D9Q98_005477 [Chlorella vulgaris]|uniref:TLC domain-containing protein n=1 Tax=Chlorella vulgaris TaxID=3077 RepID=A0A9D4YVW5_CHLVU|nr:hypothetical protein D9Q98_005477 [Chlorella vulgaris]